MGKMYKDIWYDDSATVAKFLMGGIGTGNFSIGSRGQLCDWEIFNHSMVGGKIPHTFFAIRAEDENQQTFVKVLESQIRPPYENSHGFDSQEIAGAGRFSSGKLMGRISRAKVELRDENFPVQADLAAFSPFIPLNADDSGIPGAVLRYSIRNISPQTQYISIAGSMGNPVGFSGYTRFRDMKNDGKPRNEYREKDGIKGIFMDNPELPADHLTNGSLALITTSMEHVSHKTDWICNGWVDGPHDFWNDFSSDGKLEPAGRTKHTSAISSASGYSVGSLCVDFTLAPNEEKTVEFMLCWYMPNRLGGWDGHMFPPTPNDKRTRNYYATLFTDAWNVAEYLNNNLKRLEMESDAFSKAFYATTLPDEMLTSMAANITVMRSCTCYRIENGLFLGWEGCFDNGGCCEGNCSHVWNYQQALAFLFPELERTMREVNFLMETGEDGEMAYRANTMFGNPRYTDIPPAADGQMGTIIQLYRDWKLSGDDDFLKRMWEKAKLALEYAFVKWDKDHDGVFESEQHNTYDIEFYGMSSMTNSIFYAALKAAEEMAAYLGDAERAAKYRTIRESGSAKMDKALFNGEYYIQNLKDDGQYQYQYYTGCLADQVFGQELAHISGLGYILPEEHVKKALDSVVRYNFRENMYEHLNVQRCYALNDDKGLLLCTWPKGGRPAIPFIYCDEVWTGIEYQVATHLIYEGRFEDALKIVKGVRSRYDGIKRNPWNEVECGNHYVRAMASWGMLIAASGFGFDLTKGEVWFEPHYSENEFDGFFSTGKCWGLLHQKKDPKSGIVEQKIEVLYGDKDAVRLRV